MEKAAFRSSSLGRVFAVLLASLSLVPAVSVADPIPPVTAMPLSFPVHANAVTVGPDGKIWLTAPFANQIGKLTVGGAYTGYPIPMRAAFLTASRLGQTGISGLPKVM